MPIRFGTTMNVALVMPCARITCSQSGSVSKPGWSGSEPIAVGYTSTSAPPSEYDARDLGKPLVPAGREAEARAGEVDHREARVAGPEVAVLVVAHGHGQVHLARARDERAVGRDHAIAVL